MTDGARSTRGALFAQLVVGPPGSGKTTYCRAAQAFVTAHGRRCALVNLDPAVGADDELPYSADVDVRELVTVADAMRAHALGPNGALTYCFEYLRANVDWLEEQVRGCAAAGDGGEDDDDNGNVGCDYFLFDLPGQVELYTHHGALRAVIERLASPRRLDVRFVTVNLVDSQCCSDAGKYIASSLVALMTMLQLQTPHVNVLSKADLFQREYDAQMAALAERLALGESEQPPHQGHADAGNAGGGSGGLVAPRPGTLYSLDFYTEALDLDTLLGALDGRYAQLNRAMLELLGDFSMVRFLPLDVHNTDTMATVLEACDKANGYCYLVARDAERAFRDAPQNGNRHS